MADERTGGGPAPPPGWYPDPENEQGTRFWNGREWTSQTATQEELAGVGAAPVVTPPPGTAWSEAPKPLRSIAWAAYATLALALAANLADAIISMEYANSVQTQIDDRSLTVEEAIDAEDLYAIGGGLYGIGFIAAAVGFLVWFSRAYGNLRGITRRDTRWSKGWAIGAWFVPILSLWRPKQTSNDIWRGGDPAAIDNAQWTSLPVSPLLHWWWALFLLAGIIGGIGGAMIDWDPVLSDSASAAAGGGIVGDTVPTTTDLEDERTGATVVAVSGLLEVVAAVLAIVFVYRASERQDRVIDGST